MKVACVLVDHFQFRVEAARDARLRSRRVIVYQRSGSQSTIVGVSPGLDQITPGMPLQEAQGRCKDAVLVEADTAVYEHAFDRLLQDLGYWSPVVEGAELGCAFLSLEGMEFIYPTEIRLIDELLQSLPRQLEPRLGVAEDKFQAFLAALRAKPGGAFRPPHDLRSFVGAFSVDVLPVPWEVKDRLHRFGLHTLRSVADLPLGPVQAQFGSTGLRLWRLSQGIDDEPLLARRREEKVTESMVLPAPTATLEPVLMAIENLLSRLFTRPEMRGLLARTGHLEGDVLNGPTWQRRFVFKTPVGDRPSAFLIIKARLESLTLPGPLEEVRLTLKDLTGEAGRQESLFREVRRRDQMCEAITQLKLSLGYNPMGRFCEVEPWSRIPERRAALVPYEP